MNHEQDATTQLQELVKQEQEILNQEMDVPYQELLSPEQKELNQAISRLDPKHIGALVDAKQLAEIRSCVTEDQQKLHKIIDRIVLDDPERFAALHPKTKWGEMSDCWSATRITQYWNVAGGHGGVSISDLNKAITENPECPGDRILRDMLFMHESVFMPGQPSYPDIPLEYERYEKGDPEWLSDSHDRVGQYLRNSRVV